MMQLLTTYQRRGSNLYGKYFGPINFNIACSSCLHFKSKSILLHFNYDFFSRAKGDSSKNQRVSMMEKMMITRARETPEHRQNLMKMMTTQGISRSVGHKTSSWRKRRNIHG